MIDSFVVRVGAVCALLLLFAAVLPRQETPSAPEIKNAPPPVPALVNDLPPARTTQGTSAPEGAGQRPLRQRVSVMPGKAGETVCVEGLGCWSGRTGEPVPGPDAPAAAPEKLSGWRAVYLAGLPSAGTTTPLGYAGKAPRGPDPFWIMGGGGGGALRPPPSPEPVPEPSAWWLLVTGIFALLVIKYNRQ